MISVYRIVQPQAPLYAYASTSSPENAVQLESLLEAAKPDQFVDSWHLLISTPFRYPIPVEAHYQARFKPPESDIRVLYSSKFANTALYEHAYYFIRERLHLGAEDETGNRTLFSLSLNEKKVTDLMRHPHVRALTDRKNLTASHEYIRMNPEVKGVKYPSCRDPNRGENFAVFDIHVLGKNIGEERSLSFVFQARKRSLFWVNNRLIIEWNEVN